MRVFSEDLTLCCIYDPREDTSTLEIPRELSYHIRRKWAYVNYKQLFSKKKYYYMIHNMYILL